MGSSKLQRLTGKRLIEEFGFTDLKENHRPEWMISSQGERLELDFYLPSLKIAIEVQGLQHFQHVPRFHRTADDFHQQLRRDREKKTLCLIAGVKLIEIKSTTCLSDLIEKIANLLGQKLKEPNDEFLALIKVSSPKIAKRLEKLTKLVARYAHRASIAQTPELKNKANKALKINTQALNQFLQSKSEELKHIRLKSNAHN